MRYTNALIIRAMARTKAVSATRDQGATAVEYGLMVALIAAVIVVAVALIGTKLDAIFDFVGGKIPAPPAA
jgi:pilus assembly protein Flp/PilA